MVQVPHDRLGCSAVRVLQYVVLGVLYCTVLYCTVLYCTVLYCTVLYCTVLYCTVHDNNVRAPSGRKWRPRVNGMIARIIIVDNIVYTICSGSIIALRVSPHFSHQSSLTSLIKLHHKNHSQVPIFRDPP